MDKITSSLSCEFCNKIFSTNGNCKKHKNICKYKKTHDINNIENKTLTDIIKEKDNEIKKKEEQLLRKDQEIILLKSMLETYTNKPNIVYNNSNNTVNNNLTIKKMVSKLDPINFEEVKEYMGNYSNNYKDEGSPGFAKFLCEHPFKDKFITSDGSRNTIAYKTKEHSFIRDKDPSYLLNKSIKENSNEIIENAYNRLDIINSKIKNSADDDERDKYISKKSSISKLINIAENITDDSSNITIDKESSNVFRNSGINTYKKIFEESDQKNSIE